MKGFFCYKVMLFGLNNIGATYQRLVSNIFKYLVGMTVEVYVDDIVVKSQTLQDHLGNIYMIFDVLDKAGMKLNPEKYTFRIRAGKFLGYIVSKRSIKANPNKIKAIKDMKEPNCINNIQKISMQVTALGQFISYSARRCLPFLKY